VTPLASAGAAGPRGNAFLGSQRESVSKLQSRLPYPIVTLASATQATEAAVAHFSRHSRFIE
jgi:hypothetical protein